ncbi:MAG TPA: hypothetical protein G4O02_07370 [Caldilineae bacterium]|nr:hypothetical protein [Caldilineae bacterium]
MRYALFEGLVFNEVGQPAEVVYIGDEPFYVILDADFRRHVEARYVDEQVMRWLKEQVTAHQDLVTESAMAMLGRDDLFTKAMLDHSIQNMDKQLDQLAQVGLPEEARTWLGMMGFRIIVDVHGDVVSIEMPGMPYPDEE